MADLAKVLFENVGAAIAIIVVLTLAIIAIFKINISFNVNDYMQSVKNRHRAKAQHYCAHIEFRRTNEGMAWMSLFQSPIGTNDWICSRCQSIVHHVDQEQEERNSRYWLENSKKYKANLRKFNYHSKRSS